MAYGDHHFTQGRQAAGRLTDPRQALKVMDNYDETSKRFTLTMCDANRS